MSCVITNFELRFLVNSPFHRLIQSNQKHISDMLLVEHNATDNFVDTKVVLFQFERGKKRTKTPTDLDNLPEKI